MLGKEAARTSWKLTNSQGVMLRSTLAKSATSHLYCALQVHTQAHSELALSVGKSHCKAVELCLTVDQQVGAVHAAAAAAAYSILPRNAGAGCSEASQLVQLNWFDTVWNFQTMLRTWRWEAGRTG